MTCSYTMNSTNASSNATHVSSRSFHHFLQEPFGLTIGRLIIEGIIFFIGVVGNILVCVVVVRQRLTKSLAYVFILNLAIADLGILLFSFPFGLIRTEGISWPFGWFGCKVFYPLSDVFHGVSIASITVIAIYRYRGIVAGRSPNQNRAANCAKVIIFCLWVSSFLLLVVPLFFSMEFVIFQGKHYCYPKFEKWLYFAIYQMELFVITYMLPISIILFTYVKIRARLRESIRLRHQIRRQSGLLNKTDKDSFNEKNFKALRILTPVVLVFVVTMLPYNIYRVVDIFIDTSGIKYMLIFFKMCVLAFVCNSSANPVIYALISDEFRKAFKWHLRYCVSKPLNKTNMFSLAERFTSIKKAHGKERKKSATTMLMV
ncbi:galanin receptor type 1-like [Actinia tenebrosa]|uniref:Galanin receptor type 1-like n=1 Tax=Actinia tenebrosa TaxID=6105 RepID=A0A6P8HPH0_ACTTE|nr:galanin receptor type 1-like [Actinia tenebrosa]